MIAMPDRRSISREAIGLTAIVLLAIISFFAAGEAVIRYQLFHPHKEQAAGFVLAVGIGSAIVLMWLWPSQLKK
jgi:hypothetical protein